MTWNRGSLLWRPNQARGTCLWFWGLRGKSLQFPTEMMINDLVQFCFLKVGHPKEKQHRFPSGCPCWDMLSKFAKTTAKVVHESMGQMDKPYTVSVVFQQEQPAFAKPKSFKLRPGRSKLVQGAQVEWLCSGSWCISPMAGTKIHTPDSSSHWGTKGKPQQNRGHQGVTENLLLNRLIKQNRRVPHLAIEARVSTEPAWREQVQSQSKDSEMS